MSQAEPTCGAGAPAGLQTPARRAEFLRSAMSAAFPAVRAYLFGMCGDWHDAEDLAQEALLRAWAARDGFDGRAQVATWVLAIARNAWRDRLRRRRAKPTMLPIDNDMTVPSPLPSPPAAAATVELSAAVTRAMGGLPAAQREALALREGGELTFAEIAALLDVPAATVKSRVRYALLKLADELRTLGFGPEAEP